MPRTIFVTIILVPKGKYRIGSGSARWAPLSATTVRRVCHICAGREQKLQSVNVGKIIKHGLQTMESTSADMRFAISPTLEPVAPRLTRSDFR